jgi:hypothetical protein
MDGMITQGDAPLALGCVVKPLRGKEGISSPLLGQNLELLKFEFRNPKSGTPKYETSVSDYSDVGIRIPNFGRIVIGS